MAGETLLNVFVSSPGDVQRERERVDFVVERLNAEYAGRVRLQAIRWETRYYSSHDTFQAQIPEASDCDIVLAIFGARLGSPLPASFPHMPSGESYPSGSAYEVLSAIEARRRGQGLPDVYVFRRPSAPLVALDAADREEIEQQWRRLTGFFETWFRNRGGQFLAAFQEFATTDEFAAKVEDCLRQWLTRRGFPPQVAIWDRRKRGSPYPGLAAFDESRQSVFFGRSGVIDSALRRLRDLEAPTNEGERAPFLLLIGASGSGKSSLLRAGLLPRINLPGVLPEVDLWRRAILVPGADPLLSLAEALVGDEALGRELRATPFAAPSLLAKLLAGDPDTGVAALRGALDAAAETRRREGGFETVRPARLFLVIDQAERLLIETARPAQERFAFLLAALCRARVATVVMALRSDAYPRFQTLEPFVALRAGGATLDLLPATSAELEEMATRPAEMCDPPLQFERRDGSSLAAQLIADAQGGDALPLLQMTLARLSAAEAGRGDGVLRFADYEGLAAAVSRTANEALAELDAEARAELPNLLVGLVRDYAADPATGKTVAAIGALDRARFEAGRPERRALVESFVAHRLLTAEGDAASQRVRPTHESLLRIWPEAVTLLDEAAHLIRARAAIEPLARDWADASPADKARHLDVSPALLESAQAFVKRFADDASPVTRDFVAAASALAEQRRDRERQEQQRRLADAEAIARANKRFARAAGVGLAVALGLAGLAGWQWRAAVVAEREAQTQRDRAEKALAAATETKNALVFDLAQKFRSLAGVPKPVIRDILDQARKLQDTLANVAGDDPKLRASQAAALGESAQTQISLGDLPAALDLATRARDLYAALAAKAPDSAPDVYNLAYSDDVIGDILKRQDKPVDADAAYREAQTRLEAALGRGMTEVRLEPLLASVLEDRGVLARPRDPKQALALLREGLAHTRKFVAASPDEIDSGYRLAIAYRNLGDAELDTGALDAAEGDFAAAADIAKKLAEQNPLETRLKRDYSLSLERHGKALAMKGDFAGALQAYSGGEDIAIGLAATDPSNFEWRYDLAVGHVEIGDMQLKLGRPADAVQSYTQAAELDEALIAKDFTDADWRRHYDDTLTRLALARQQTGDVAGALATFAASAALEAKVLAVAVNDRDWLERAVQTRDRLGVLLRDNGKIDEARTTLADAVVKARALPADRPARELLLGAQIQAATAAIYAGDAQTAVPGFLEAETLARALIQEAPDDAAPKRELAQLTVPQARALASLGRYPEAIAKLEDEVTLCKAQDEAAPSDSFWRSELRSAYDALGDARRRSGDAPGAIDAYRQSLAAFAGLPDSIRNDLGTQIGAMLTREALAPLLVHSRQLVEALATLEDAVATRKTLADDAGNTRALLFDELFAAGVSAGQGDNAGALTLYGDALAVARAAAAKPDADASARFNLAQALQFLGFQQEMAKDPAGAAANLAEALPIAMALALQTPDNAVYARLVSSIGGVLAQARLETGDRAGAARALIAARDADKAALALAPDNKADAANLNADVANLGVVANAQVLAREFEAALATLDQATPSGANQAGLDLVRAGALMFLNRAAEAKALLDSHRGETFAGQPWENGVVAAIADLRAKGFSHPAMDELAKAFSPQD